MIELELLGTGADGQSLVMTDAEGERYSVPITDELRGAVRRDRPRLESVTTPQQRPLRPREIQALLRSGLTAEELARESSMDIAHIRRFEAPVAAEKEWMLTRALDSHVGGDRDAPVMGDLVVDRLAARGVDPASLVWSARRADEGPWEIALTFLQGAAEHAAHWRMTPSATAVEAVDQEARWLTETAAPSPVSAVFTPLPARPEHPVDEGDADLRARDALLDQLNAARGHRESIDIPLEEDFEDSLDEEDTEESRTGRPTGSLSARIYSLAHARTRPAPPAPHGSDSPTVPSGGAPAAEGAGRGDGDQSDIGGTPGPGTPPAPTARASSLPQLPNAPRAGTVPPPDAPSPHEGDTLPGLEDVSPSPTRPEREKKHSRRRSVPSWDEIVFGSRPQ